MGLTKYRLGDLLEQLDERNGNEQYGISDVRGMSIQKAFIDTKANMDDVSLKPYKIVPPDSFAYVTITSRNGEKITLAHNDGNETYIVSSSYIVFVVKEKALLDSDYLFMYFNRPEFDRYARFNSWGSAREAFSWEDLCDVVIDLPSLNVQRKYAAIYNGLLENQRCYERGLDDLKIVCDGFIDDLRCRLPLQRLAPLVKELDVRNEGRLGLNSVRGISIEKKFIGTKANMEGVSLSPYKIVGPNQFAYVPVTSRNGEKITLALNNSDQDYLVSSSYIVFECCDSQALDPGYLFMFFTRPEFDRYSRFNSWGSARETFGWNDMQDVQIPIPDISVQRSIADVHRVYLERKRINEQLKVQLKDICPILIKGSLEEASR